jgi:hypothetical protein
MGCIAVVTHYGRSEWQSKAVHVTGGNEREEEEETRFP